MDIILLNLRISMWGITRSLGTNEYQVEADKSLTRATKKILECPEYEYLMTIKRRLHRDLEGLALPGNVLRAGIYPVSVPMVPKIESLLEDFSIKWAVGLDSLGAAWDMRISEVRERLNGLYDDADYPPWEKVKGQFQIKWSYFTMDTPSSLANLDKRVYQREQAKAAEDWANLTEEIKDGLRLTFKTLVNELLDRLNPKGGGKKRIVKLDKLMEFVDMFSRKDVANDAELRLLVDDMKGILSDIDLKDLKKDVGIRQFVADQVASVATVLDTLVEDAPTRKMRLVD